MAKEVPSYEFTVNVTGDVTGENFAGKFKMRTTLPHKMQLEMDELRRSLLGSNPGAASPRAINQAEVFAQINTYRLAAPSWWDDFNGGLDLEDNNVVQEVYQGLIDGIAKRLEDAKKKVDALKKDIVTAAPVAPLPVAPVAAPGTVSIPLMNVGPS
jgi:hypothetical protein